MPRLRAVSHSEPEIDVSRFDSGAFDYDLSDVESEAPTPIAIGRAAEEAGPVQGNQTADLLEALRRRRGEREAANFDDDETRGSHPSTGTIRIVDIPLDSMPEEPVSPRQTAPQPSVRRKGRAAMPSWDEIVFGARPDDDLA
jgi:hypothetical protein